jgi:hypothetical protein
LPVSVAMLGVHERFALDAVEHFVIGVAEMNTTPDNFDRLLLHLKDNSLAAALVHAYRDSAPGKPREVLKAVLKTRLELLRKTLAG